MTRRHSLGLLLVVPVLIGACDAGFGPSPSSLPEQSGAPTASTPTDALPPSGQIAFRRDDGGSRSQVFITDVAGSIETQLTHEAGSVDHLVWAPDGSRLYFQSTEPSGCGESYCYPNRVVSVRADGSDRVDLGQVGAYGVGVVSPDRRYVAYPAGEGYADDFSQSFTIAAQLVDLLAGTMSSLEIASSTIVWSPDGTRLLGAVSGRILIIDAQSPANQLGLDDPWVQTDSPVGWSADGGSIFYHRCAPELDKDQAMACFAGPSWVVDLSDPNLVPQLNSGPEPPTGALSPDGFWFADFVDAGADRGLYLKPAAGGAPVLVARLELDAGTVEHLPAWSSDGAWLAIGIPGGIHVVAAAGGEARFVAQGDVPAWQPSDG